MSEQISLRLSSKLLKDAKKEAKSRGYRSVQSFIEQVVREELYDNELTPYELKLIQAVIEKNHSEPTIKGKELDAALRISVGKSKGNAIKD